MVLEILKTKGEMSGLIEEEFFHVSLKNVNSALMF